MSQELAEALRHFIAESLRNDERFAEYDHSHDEDYAEPDHSHDNGDFEDKVNYYLGANFHVGGGCETQRNFERAVMMCVQHWFDTAAIGGIDNSVRAVLRAVLNEGRRKDPLAVVPILTRCLNELCAIPTMPVNVPDSNGLTYTRT